ncbi:hypothetical protein D1872_209810 [compost metagenome]
MYLLDAVDTDAHKKVVVLEQPQQLVIQDRSVGRNVVPHPAAMTGHQLVDVFDCEKKNLLIHQRFPTEKSDIKQLLVSIQMSVPIIDARLGGFPGHQHAAVPVIAAVAETVGTSQVAVMGQIQP